MNNDNSSISSGCRHVFFFSLETIFWKLTKSRMSDGYISLSLVQIKPNIQDISLFRAYFLFQSSCDLENEVKITILKSCLKLDPVAYPCKFRKFHRWKISWFQGTALPTLIPTGLPLKTVLGGDGIMSGIRTIRHHVIFSILGQ